MSKIYVTRTIPGEGISMLRKAGHTVTVNEKEGAHTREELLSVLKAGGFDGVLSQLEDKIDAEVFAAAPTVKIFSNYAVGYNNIDIDEAKKRGVVATNTPGVLTDTVAEHAFALILAITCRIVEGDKMLRAGEYKGWMPELLLGTDLKGKTLGILGAGRIGARVAYHAKRGFDMQVVYNDPSPNEYLDKELGARFMKTTEEVLRAADVVSIHVPLLPTTKHLLNKERLAMMKPSAYLINTSRGPVIDEAALVEALKNKVIKGAALDVFEHEPALTPGLADLPNIVIAPHIASATEETRAAMSRLAAENLIAFFEGKVPPNKVL